MDKTLVILAAGMGSRFGGLKQIEPMGPNGEFIIDYSIYDAIRVGFTKVVFIIKRENYDIFKETVGKRVENHIKVEYVFQENNNLPEGVVLPEDRVKPLGTAHAVLCCKDVVNEDFAIINADDFYGRDAYEKAIKFFNEDHKDEYAIIGYKIKNTLTENGSVKRGVCKAENGYLTKLIESSVEEKEGHIIASPLNGSEPFEIDADDPVSMNLFCFKKDIFNYLEEHFIEFFDVNKDNLDKCEYLIPDIVFNMMSEGLIKVPIIPTVAKWYGVTYKEDTDYVKAAIKELIKEGEYPNNLWD